MVRFSIKAINTISPQGTQGFTGLNLIPRGNSGADQYVFKSTFSGLLFSPGLTPCNPALRQAQGPERSRGMEGLSGGRAVVS